MTKHCDKWFQIANEIEANKPMKDIANEFKVSYQYVTLVGRELKFRKEKETKENCSSSKRNLGEKNEKLSFA